VVKVKSKRPYLLRALFEWIVDSGLTPYILVAASDPDVVVPRQHVSDGKIVLNVSSAAVRDLAFDDDLVRFNGRFSGTPFAVTVPVVHVLAIYARETGEGMMFEPEQSSPGTSAESELRALSDSGKKADRGKKSNAGKKTGPGPHLKVIK